MTIAHPPAYWTREEWQEVRRQVMEPLETAEECRLRDRKVKDD